MFNLKTAWSMEYSKWDLFYANLHHGYRALLTNASHEKHRYVSQRLWDIKANNLQRFQVSSVFFLFVCFSHFPGDQGSCDWTSWPTGIAYQLSKPAGLQSGLAEEYRSQRNEVLTDFIRKDIPKLTLLPVIVLLPTPLPGCDMGLATLADTNGHTWEPP